MAGDLKYTKDHIWIKPVGKKKVRIGLSEYALEKIGEIDYITLPDIGDDIEKTDNFGEIESSSTVFELISPFTGNVVEVNEETIHYPGIINTDPLGNGWLIEAEMESNLDSVQLMEPDEYEEFVQQNAGEES
ncbi:MAG TPA: glycine cleavage system protein H [bacterium]